MLVVNVGREFLFDKISNDGLAGSALAPFRYGIEEDIGAVVDAGVIVPYKMMFHTVFHPEGMEEI